MTCCEYRKCTNAPNCPVRQAHREAANRAYIERGRVVDTDPAEEVFASVKALIAWLALMGCVAMVALAFWRML